MADQTPAGWHPDPTGRAEHRYWDGTAWTDHVSSGGLQAVDPLQPPVGGAVDTTTAEPAATAPTRPDAGTPVEARPSTAGPETGPPATWPASTAASSPASPTGASTAATAPLRLCPHCRAQSATTDATCPNCGKRYNASKKWVWALLALFALLVLGFVGCVAIVGTAVDEGVKATNRAFAELSAEQRRHAITPAQFAAVQLGSSRAEVVEQLGREPENAQEFVQSGVLEGSEISSGCIYYNQVGELFGSRYQFCFENDELTSKNSY